MRICLLQLAVVVIFCPLYSTTANGSGDEIFDEMLSRASELYNSGQFSEALEIFEKISTEPNTIPRSIRSLALSSQALCMKALSQPPESFRHHLQLAIALDPLSLLPWIQLAVINSPAFSNASESESTDAFRTLSALIRLMSLWTLPNSQNPHNASVVRGGRQLARDGIRLASAWIRSGIAALRAGDNAHAGRLCDAGRALLTRAAAAADTAVPPPLLGAAESG